MGWRCSPVVRRPRSPISLHSAIPAASTNASSRRPRVLDEPHSLLQLPEVVVITTLLVAALVSGGPDPVVPTVRVERLSGSITIDGKLDEAIWQREPAMSGLVQSY